MSVLRLALVAALLGCSSEGGEAPAVTDTGAAVTDTASTTATLGKIKVTVRYAGARRGQLAIGAFTEAEPKTQPPVTFDTTKSPVFPYQGELRALEPGTYWVIALLDVEPYSGASVRPGVEDLSATSAAVELKAGDERTVELTIAD